ncbi:MAG: hypothetical protein A2Z11_03030 [Candidatus Woykebacteria bacterium RBG_16_43_9]|uniref:Type IV secretion system coupling protein TraD DNA-binding domain-containing protein n=1 Tax=Candidatus Woykebacteria bacterium RBG_16_43_9 TaxID=1802596 RepID=A0A1G1WC81_9BACT|nr:MAG: hypothetical protein A2Z11_03030 [Candidatus Woykebacteria bacterium RBG_16_43_9]
MQLLITIVAAFLFFIFLFSLIIALVMFRRFAKRRKKSLLYTQLEVKLPRQNEIKIEAAESFFTSLYSLFRHGVNGLLAGQEHIGFEIVSAGGVIKFFVSAPNELVSLVEKQIHSYYPEAEVDQVDEYNFFRPEMYVDMAELSLRAPSYRPILRFNQMKEIEPINSITTAMSKLDAGEGMALQILIAPAGTGWQGVGFSQIHKSQTVEKKSIMTPFNLPPSHQQTQPEAPSQPEAKTESITGDPYKKIEEKVSKPGYETVIRVVVSAKDQITARSYIENMVGAFGQFNDPTANGFRKRRFPWTLTKILALKHFIYKMMPFWFGKMILNSEELATIFHFPNKNVVTPNIDWLLAKKAAAPNIVPTEGLYLGKSKFRGVETKVHILPDDRRRHMYIIGQTGTGKSEFMKFMAVQDIKEGKGVCFIDPHGSAIEDILLQIPPERAEDVIFFDAGDTERPLGLNILEAKSEEQKHQIVNNFIHLLYKLYDPKRTGIMGPRLERAIRNVMLTAMSEEGSTLVEVLRLLTDPGFVKQKLPKVADPLVKRYWTDEVAQTSAFHKSEVMGYFVSKFDRFVTDKLLRNIIGQGRSAFDFRAVMDEGKILLVDLSKGKIGEENSNFLGLVLVPRILVAAMGRVDIPEEERSDFHLYVDEFQNFTTPDFAQILSEARKYHLNLTVANQFIAQIQEEGIREAVFGNVGTLIAFRVGIDDATYLEHQFDPVFKKEDLINNPLGHAYMRLLVNGQPSYPFSMATDWEMMKDAARNKEVAESIVELSRLRYGCDRGLVEAEISQRAGLDEPSTVLAEPPKPAQTQSARPTAPNPAPTQIPPQPRDVKTGET